MADPAPIVTDLHRLPGQTTDGIKHLARFRCEIGGLILLELALIRRHDGSLHVPNATRATRGRPTRGVVIADDALRASILAAAVAAYEAAPPAEPADNLPPRRHRGRRRAG